MYNSAKCDPVVCVAQSPSVQPISNVSEKVNNVLNNNHEVFAIITQIEQKLGIGEDNCKNGLQPSNIPEYLDIAREQTEDIWRRLDRINNML